jgi:hypothetical protein
VALAIESTGHITGRRTKHQTGRFTGPYWATHCTQMHRTAPGRPGAGPGAGEALGPLLGDELGTPVEMSRLLLGEALGMTLGDALAENRGQHSDWHLGCTTLGDELLHHAFSPSTVGDRLGE